MPSSVHQRSQRGGAAKARERTSSSKNPSRTFEPITPPARGEVSRTWASTPVFAQRVRAGQTEDAPPPQSLEQKSHAAERPSMSECFREQRFGRQLLLFEVGIEDHSQIVRIKIRPSHVVRIRRVRAKPTHLRVKLPTAPTRLQNNSDRSRAKLARNFVF